MNPIVAPSKQCTLCKEWKTLDLFNKASKKKDGLQAECRDCHNERCRIYRQKHPDKVKASQQKHREANAERIKEKTREYGRRYRAQNRERLAEQRRQDRLNNFEEYRAREKKKYAARKDKLREKRLNDFYGITSQEYIFLLQQQNNKCACCGVDQGDVASFNVDHDHDDGRVRGLLCRSCNLGIGQLGDKVDGLMAAIAYLQDQTTRTQEALHYFRSRNDAVLFAKDRCSIEDPEGLCD